MKGKKKGISIVLELALVVIVALVVLMIMTTIFSVSLLRKSLKENTLDGVKEVAASIQGSLDLLSYGDYTEIDGIVYKGNYALGANPGILDTFVEGTEIDVSFFIGETRMLTTITNSKGVRMTGKPCSAEVKRIVIENGETFTSTDYLVDGVRYYAVIVPLKGNDGSVDGMLFVGEPIAQKSKDLQLGVVKMLGISIFLLVVVAAIAALFVTKIAKSIKALNTTLVSVSEGDLTVEVPQIALNRPDEVGQMASALKSTVENMRGVLGDIEIVTETLVATGDELQKNADLSSTTADEIGCAIDDISKGAVSQAEDIETAKSSVSEMGDGFGHIIESVGLLNASADDMLDADEASAAIIEELSISNEETTRAIREVGERVDATDHSVQKIQEAVTLIASIADQTNLLSLNASIEAARAGDAGRGFAVVASEISKLAEESQDSANRIGEIILQLSADSQATVAVMSKMAEIAKIQQEKLEQTKTKFESVSKGIKLTIEQADSIRRESDNCNVSKGKVVDIITNLSAVSEENAASTEETTASMQEFNATINLLAQSAKDLEQVAVKLEENVSFFKLK